MSILCTAVRGLFAATALSILVAGCSSSTTPPVTPDDAPPVVVAPPEEIEGVAIASSVAVVTATNAQ